MDYTQLQSCKLSTKFHEETIQKLVIGGGELISRSNNFHWMGEAKWRKVWWKVRYSEKIALWTAKLFHSLLLETVIGGVTICHMTLNKNILLIYRAHYFSNSLNGIV